MALTELVPPSGADPLALRWLRILAGHPWRSTLALALLFWSLGSRSSAAPGGARSPPAP